jgi:hypothetical protein
MSYTHIIPIATTYYYFAEITQADGNKIWTAPVWFTRNADAPSFELLSFTAVKSGYHGLLDWSTLNEFNTDYFNVEKSTDGVVFNFATTENATGSLGNTAVYSWLDPDTLFNSTWYRLNIFDINGLSQLSPVRRLDLSELSFNINIYPNPAGDEDIWCNISHNRVEPMRMEIFSADGKLVLNSNFYSEKGTLKFIFPAERLSRGLYTIRFSNSDYSLNSSNRFIRH